MPDRASLGFFKASCSRCREIQRWYPSIAARRQEGRPKRGPGHPPDGAVFSATPITVNGTVSDALSGFSALTCNGVSATPSGGSFSCNISLAVGVNLIVVRATDIAGNVAASSFHVTLSGALPAPNSLQVTPANVNMLIGETKQFTAVDQSGRPRSDATWTLSNTSLASIDTASSPTLTAKAAGQVTLTAAVGSFTAQTQVNIFSGTSLPSGTVRWSLPTTPGFTALQTLQAIPVNSGPDLYSPEWNGNGDGSTLVRGVTADGQQLWAAPLAPGYSPTGMSDGNGGILVELNPFTNNNGTLPIIDLDAQTGAPIWEYDTPNTFGQECCLAIGQDAKVYLFEHYNSPGLIAGAYLPSTLIALDGSTGALLNRYVDIGVENTETTSDGTFLLGYPQPEALTVGPDGTVLAWTTSWRLFPNASNTAFSFQLTSYLVQIAGGGAPILTPLRSWTSYLPGAENFYFGPTAFIPLPGTIPNLVTTSRVITDGQGGALILWWEQVSTQGGSLAANYQAHITHVAGSTVSDFLPPFSLGQSFPFGKTPIVLGENGVAFASDSQTLLAFNVSTLTPLWTYSAPQGTALSIVTSTDTGGVITKATNSSTDLDTVIRLDSNGTPTQDTWTASKLDYWAGDLWLGSSGGAVTGYSAPLVQFSSSAWPAPDMFGTNQAIQNLNVTNFSQTGPNQTTIIGTLQKLQTLLPSYNSCNNWLQGGGTFTGQSGLQQIRDLLSGNFFGHGIINRETIPAYDIGAFSGSLNPGKTPVPGLPENPAPVFTVNDIGAFFNSTDNQARQLPVGKRNYAGNSVRAQLFILLHELAHQITVSGFQPDFGNPKAGRANDELVDTYCRGLIEGPSIKGLTPSSGPVGTTVTITGQNFGTTQGTSTVTFNNGIAASPTTWSDTQIVVTVPVGATTGNIVVTVGGSGGQSASKNFTVQ